MASRIDGGVDGTCRQASFALRASPTLYVHRHSRGEEADRIRMHVSRVGWIPGTREGIRQYKRGRSQGSGSDGRNDDRDHGVAATGSDACRAHARVGRRGRGGCAEHRQPAPPLSRAGVPTARVRSWHSRHVYNLGASTRLGTRRPWSSHSSITG